VIECVTYNEKYLYVDFFSMKIYATARGTQVADANIKYTLNN